MPQAVTHFLIPAVLAAIFRDIYNKKAKKKIALHYVLLAGLGGLMPDLDIAAFTILHFFGFQFSDVHRTYTHSIFFPLLFLLLYFIFTNINLKSLGKHKITLHGIFLAFAFGSSMHLLLDFLISGYIYPLYPLSFVKAGIDLINLLPSPLDSLGLPIIDAALLVLWLIYLEWRHKLSEFI